MKVKYPAILSRTVRLVALVGSLIWALGSPAQAQDRVRIGVGVDPGYVSWWIAQEKGFYKKHNIRAEITQFSGGPALADATMAGEMDIGASGTATWMPRIVRGSMVVLATMLTSSNAYNLAARTSIKSLADLKGKKVGTVGGSSTDYLWTLVSRKLQLPENSLQLISMQPPELVPSLDRGDIEAFFSWEPWPSRAVEVSGKDKVHILASSGDIGYYLYFVVVANRKFVEANPEATVRVLAALRDAIDYQKANAADTVKIASEKNKMKPEMAANMLGMFNFGLGLSEEVTRSARTEEAWMRSKGQVKGDPVDWSKTIDRRFLDRALAIK